MLGLSLAGVAAPIAVSAMAATGGFHGSPLVASALLALLVLAPAGVGLATALSGLRHLAAALSARGDREAEQAVLRILVDALIFFYASGAGGGEPQRAPAAPYLAVAAFGLVAAWALLLYVILWPAASPARRLGTMALDIALFSAFLHFGGAAVAGWYPLYLLATLYAGFRFGLGALVGTATLSILGFAAVVLSTEIWQRQPVLASGLILGLAVLPGFVAGAIRRVGSAQHDAAQADADRRRVVRVITDNLRSPMAIARAIPAIASPIGDVLDFAALDAGSFAAPVEAFGLRDLVKRSLAPIQVDAAAAGVLLRWRVDPHLPGRLRGRAQALARLLASLAGHAVAVRGSGTVRVAVDAVASDTRRLRLRLIVETSGGEREPDLAPGVAAGDEPLAMLLARRLAARLGGAFAIERAPDQRTRLVVTLGLEIEEGAAEPTLDLGNRQVLIATEDAEFASKLGETVAAWNGDVRWVGDADGALANLSRHGATERQVLIVDGRKLLGALSLAHRAARIRVPAPFVLLIAEDGQIASLGEVDDGEIDGFIPAPPTRQLLANALDALPLGLLDPLASDLPATPPIVYPPRPAVEPPGELNELAPGELSGRFSERITPIAAHPKFAPETATALDMRAIDGLRALGGRPGFPRRSDRDLSGRCAADHGRTRPGRRRRRRRRASRGASARCAAPPARSAAPSFASSWRRCKKSPPASCASTAPFTFSALMPRSTGSAPR